MNPNNFVKYFGFAMVGLAAFTFLVLPKLADYYAQVEVAEEINEHRRKKRDERLAQTKVASEGEQKH
jgi:hypothetical protein